MIKIISFFFPYLFTNEKMSKLFELIQALHGTTYLLGPFPCVSPSP